MKKILAVMLLLETAGFCGDIYPEQNKGQAGLPGEFLSNFSASARAMGRGKTGVTLSDDPSGVYFNPASLATTVTRKVSFLNSSLFYDTDYNYLGYAHPFGERVSAGISMLNLKSEGAQETNELGDPTGRTFGETQRAYILSYARKLSDRVDWGINSKFLNQNMLDYSAFGYGLDLGILWRSPFASTWGFMLQNAIQPKMELKNEKETYPMNFRAGYRLDVSRNFKLYQDFLYQNILPDSKLFDGGAKSTFYFNSGIEYLHKNFALRAGMDNKDVSFGFGLKSRFFDFDYAVNSHYLGITHHFSTSFNFGLLPTEEERRLAQTRKELEIKELYGEALEGYNENDFERAKKYAKKCFEIDPEHKKAGKILQKVELKERRFKARELYEQAFVDFDKGEEENAYKKIKEANELDPDAARTLEKEYLAGAEENLKHKQYKKCRENLMKVLRINKENKEANGMLKKLETILEIMEEK